MVYFHKTDNSMYFWLHSFPKTSIFCAMFILDQNYELVLNVWGPMLVSMNLLSYFNTTPLIILITYILGYNVKPNVNNLFSLLDSLKSHLTRNNNTALTFATIENANSTITSIKNLVAFKCGVGVSLDPYTCHSIIKDFILLQYP